MFNDRLRSARMFRGFTLQKTADAIGVYLRHYQKYEAGEVEPDLARLTSLAEFLSVPTDWLLGRDEYLSSLGVSVDVPPEAPPRHPRPRKNQ